MVVKMLDHNDDIKWEAVGGSRQALRDASRKLSALPGLGFLPQRASDKDWVALLV